MTRPTVLDAMHRAVVRVERPGYAAFTGRLVSMSPKRGPRRDRWRRCRVQLPTGKFLTVDTEHVSVAATPSTRTKDLRTDA